MNKVRALLFIAAWVAIWGMWKQHERIGELNTKNAELLVELTEQVKINEDYQERVQSLHKLDIKYTQELANAKSEIDKLRDDVRNGSKRVYVNAKCPSPKNSPTSSVDAGRSPTLEGDVREDYFDLFKQLATLEKQYLGLRDYYFTECKR
ncbi:lysis protein [Providencia sp. PROV039]|uniref:lysis protein n=1 Tax=Providencia sp. PROV039 TaxID=2949770 RepID=UPI002349CA17|nr:lysis protein [Providencia sp. PROV039]